MPNLRKRLATAVLLGLTAGAFGLYAQPVPDPTGPGDAGDQSEPSEATSDVSVPLSQEARVSPGEMEARTRELSAEVEEHRQRIEALKDEARKKKDIIKLNCINDKQLQVKQLLNIMDDGLARLTVAIATGDESERYHRYTIVTVSAEKIRGLRDEAEACIGEEISYLGPLNLEVEEPDVTDDPTVEDPFGDNVIDPPGYASPFL